MNAIPLWPDGVPNLAPDGRPEEIFNERFRNVSNPTLSVHLPLPEKSRGTALIIAAGGGYKHVAMCIHVDPLIAPLNDAGIAVFGLKYRTSYGNNDVAADALADGQRAVRIVRSRAAEWKLDPRRIGFQGYSAGGHLALNLATHFDAGNASAADPIDRVSCRPDFVALMCPSSNQQSIDAFPMSEITPPMFVANAKDDTVTPFPFAQEISDKLGRTGIAHHFLAVSTGGHASFHYGTDSEGANWPDVLLPWMRQIGML